MFCTVSGEAWEPLSSRARGLWDVRVEARRSLGFRLEDLRSLV